MGCHFLLPGIFPTQGWNPGLPHCRRILYRLSHQGSRKQIFINIKNKTISEKSLTIQKPTPDTRPHFRCVGSGRRRPAQRKAGRRENTTSRAGRRQDAQPGAAGAPCHSPGARAGPTPGHAGSLWETGLAARVPPRPSTPVIEGVLLAEIPKMLLLLFSQGAEQLALAPVPTFAHGEHRKSAHLH